MSSGDTDVPMQVEGVKEQARALLCEGNHFPGELNANQGSGRLRCICGMAWLDTGTRNKPEHVFIFGIHSADMMKQP